MEERTPRDAAAEVLEAASPSLEAYALDPGAFLRWVRERVSASAATGGRLHAADLALAFGCAQGNRKALAAFERVLEAAVKGDDREELKQRLRERLLVAPRGEAPRITLYNGRGPLPAWTRTAAARITVDLHRGKGALGRVDPDAAADQIAASGDLELDHLKRLYRRELGEALQTVLATLSTREANIFKLHFLDQVSAQAIGRMYSVHARTVQRWITLARERILAETRAILAAKLGLGNSQIQSLLRIARSDLDASLTRYLAGNR